MPFGRAARRPPRGEPGARGDPPGGREGEPSAWGGEASAWGGEPSERDPGRASRPSRPEDFWGEASGEMQDVVQAPMPPAAVSVTPPGEPRPSRRRRREFKRPRLPRAAAMALLSTAALMCVVLAKVLTGTQSGVPPPAHASRPRTRTNGFGASLGRRLTLATTSLGTQRWSRLAEPASKVHRKSRTAGSSPGPPPHDSSGSPSYVASASTGLTHSPSAGTTGGAVTAVAVPAPSARVHSSGAQTGPSSSSQSISSSSGTSSSSAGGASGARSPSATVTPAFGASGALGPGSSPNG